MSRMWSICAGSLAEIFAIPPTHGHTLASSLVSGYHLAFAIGAASIAVGIVTALVVLRTRYVPADAHPAEESELTVNIVIEPEPQIERQAA